MRHIHFPHPDQTGSAHILELSEIIESLESIWYGLRHGVHEGWFEHWLGRAAYTAWYAKELHNVFRRLTSTEWEHWDRFDSAYYFLWETPPSLPDWLNNCGYFASNRSFLLLRGLQASLRKRARIYLGKGVSINRWLSDFFGENVNSRGCSLSYLDSAHAELDRRGICTIPNFYERYGWSEYPSEFIEYPYSQCAL